MTVNVWKEERKDSRQLVLPLLAFSGVLPLSPMIPDYITERAIPEERRGWKEKTVSLPAARRHLYCMIVGILICRQTVASGHDITSLDNMPKQRIRSLTSHGS